jgi:DNA polymerase III sliding clamp (beta) subunit (PCNA family)
MLIRIPINDLKFCLSIAFSATLTNKNRPILNNVLLTIEQQFTEDGKPPQLSGKLSAHDGDVTVSCGLHNIQVDGQITARQFSVLLPPVVQSIVNELPQAHSVELHVSEDSVQNITLVGGMGRFRLSTADPAEFPPTNVASGFEADIEVDGALLQRAIARVLPACDQDQTRFALGCILFNLSGVNDTLSLVTTDAKRLHVNDIPCTVNGNDLTERWKMILVPVAAAKLLAKIAKDSPAVKLRAEGSTLYAEGRGIAVECRLNAGRFPKWEAVIPRTSQMIELETQAFLKSLRAAAATVGKDEDNATLTFGTVNGEGHLKIVIENADGNASVDCPLPQPVKPWTTTLRAMYVTQALSAMAADEPVEMHAPEDAGGAVRLHQMACQFTTVIMPIDTPE